VPARKVEAVDLIGLVWVRVRVRVRGRVRVRVRVRVRGRVRGRVRVRVRVRARVRARARVSASSSIKALPALIDAIAADVSSLATSPDVSQRLSFSVLKLSLRLPASIVILPPSTEYSVTVQPASANV
jgi:hypothetical protein